MKTKNIVFVGIMAILISSSAIAEEAPITQGEWAVYLARGLGLEKAMPEGSSADKYISVLGNKGYRRIEGEDYYKITPELSITESGETGLSGKNKWVKAGDKPGTVSYRFEIPVGRKYTIRTRNRGMIQFWTTDDQGSVMVSPEDDFSWNEVGEFDLKPGPHMITVAIPSGGGIDLIELLTGGFPSIAPAGGFNSLAPLTYEEKAVTIVKALNREDELPIAPGFSLVLEAELYERAEGGGQVSQDENQGAASRKKWLRAEDDLRVFYNFEVPEPGLYTIQARDFGDQKEEWIFDRGEEQVVSIPESPGRFGWKPVTKIILEPGPHTIETRVKAGNGIDAIMIVRRRAEGINYLQLLSDLGLQEGALPAKKAVAGSRRYQPYQTVEAEQYREVIGEIEKSDSDQHGTPSGLSWIKPKNGSAVCRYEVELKEDGMYALYMSSFGPNYFTWTIDPEGDSFLAQMNSFSPDEEEFSWGEVVTLELSRGKHIFEVAMPAYSGLDTFELRKRAWSQAELEKLSRKPVSREEALRNLEEVEERGEAPPEEDKSDEDPDPPDEPEPPNEYTPLSPYIPGA